MDQPAQLPLHRNYIYQGLLIWRQALLHAKVIQKIINLVISELWLYQPNKFQKAQSRNPIIELS